VDFGDQRHVGKDVGVAHMIDGWLASRLDDGTAWIAEINRRAIDDVA
jgi:hypothetical protein